MSSPTIPVQRGRRIAAVAALSAALAVGGATAASAATTSGSGSTVRPNAYSSYVDSYYYSGVNLRSCGSTGCTSYAYMPNGTGVNMICWEDTQTVSPPLSNYTSARWFEVSSPYGVGFVHSSLVFNQTSVGHC